MTARLGRREFIAGSAVAAVAAWTAPQILTVEPAGAVTRHSGPPQHQPEHVPQPPMGPPLATGLPGTLPFTGDSEGREVVVGAAALATGAVLVAANREGREPLS